ncbi:hypothetical protein ACFOEL_09295 [Virgibacillus litoralis]
MKKRGFLMMTLAIVFVVTFVLTNVAGAKSYGPVVSKQLSEVRQATAKYHDIEAAFEDGYGPKDETKYHLVPNMGIHLTNNELLGTSTNDPLAPEVLVYEPKKNGGYKLVAVEYMSLGEERPSLFGQEFDDGPFPGSFALHAWVWQANPDGMFSPLNPNVANVE